MRFVSTILVVFIFACLLLAQAPVGFGPGTQGVGLLDFFDWYAATPSGCTVGAYGMCVGTSPVGDTQYYTGWFSDASMLPVTTGLPIVGTLNDFTSRTCSGNLMVTQLAAFDWAARSASSIYEVNCMSSYGSAPGSTDSPAGWKGHCASGDSYGPGDCGWKSRNPFVRNGLLYLPVERQISAGTASVHDATLIVSADGGKTWKNPYTVAHGGAASATGDAPSCGAAAGGAGNPCTDASYPGSMMWPALPATSLYQWGAVEYGQDGTTLPSGVNDGCDPATYTCFLGGPEGTLARVLNSDLPSLDVTKWQYYTCPAITDTYRCHGNIAGSWTSVFADRTQVMVPNWSWSIVYLKEFKSYLMASANGFYWATAIQGPWTFVKASPNSGVGIVGEVNMTFAGIMLGQGYTVVSTNPPRVKVTLSSDSHYTPGYPSGCTLIFSRWDVTLGKLPMLMASESAHYYNVGRAGFNAGLVLSDSHAPGTIPRKDLAWAFDFYDHGGNTSSGITGFHDIANGAAFIVPCLGNPTWSCQWSSGQGITLQPYGANLQDNGYGVHLVTAMHETPQTIAIGAANYTTTGTSGLSLQNIPSAMQGNGSYTVAEVFRINGTGYNQVPLWLAGTSSGSNTEVALSYPNSAGGPLELGWGVSANRWRYLSAFTPGTGNWYFLACTVQANGATPIGHMWVGAGGTLVDKIAGISRSSTGGSPTQTPNVAAAPMLLGIEPGATHHTNASYANLFVYGRALSQAEVGLMYQTVKAEMAARGVTVQ